MSRAVKQYFGYDPNEMSWSDAGSVADDTIVEQSQTDFDADGNAIFVTTWRRMENTVGTGELQYPFGSQPFARASYQATYYDGIGRQVATVNYGTGDGYDVSVRPSTIPDSSDTVLVNLMGYNDRGEAFAAIDPAGIESRTLFDDLGRKVCVIANYQDEPNTPDQNNTIAYSYNADGQLLTLTAVNPDTDDQVTRYVYGTTLAESGVARADLLRAEIYPDSDDTAPDLGDGADGVYDRIEYTYNRTGQVVTKTDQNGTVHAYSYDGLGRRVQDSVTAVGSGIDNAVRSISTSYEVRGLVASLTSYSTPQADSGSIANQVELQYNAFGLLVADYQSHAGAVNVSTTSKVQYTYADGSANTVRRTQVVYPNGRAGLPVQLRHGRCPESGELPGRRFRRQPRPTPGRIRLSGRQSHRAGQLSSAATRHRLG